MSHVARLTTKIRDLSTLRTACQRCEIKPPVDPGRYAGLLDPDPASGQGEVE